MTDEEKMNDLMNKISLEFKNETLQTGFEIICKRMAELKKENINLKAKNEKLKEDVEYWKNEYDYLRANPEEA